MAASRGLPWRPREPPGGGSDLQLPPGGLGGKERPGSGSFCHAVWSKDAETTRSIPSSPPCEYARTWSRRGRWGLSAKKAEREKLSTAIAKSEPVAS